MKMPENTFKKWLLDKPSAAPVGSWLMTGSAVAAEAMGCAGFDFLVVDMEHVPIAIPQALPILHAIAGTPAVPVVRLPWNDMVIVKQALDAGAQTLMLPFIQNAEEARLAVSFTQYPPLGVRGVAAVHRASRYGAVPDYLHHAGREIAVIVQLETPEAISHLEEIAAVPGVDAIFIGPGDLSASMGHMGDIACEPVQAALKDAVTRCIAIGKPCGIVGGTPEMVQRYIDWGYHFVAIGSDIAMMTRHAGQVLGALRGSADNGMIAAMKPGASAY